MSERIDFLIDEIQKLEESKTSQTLESVKRLIDKEIKTLQNELTDLQVKFQPKRFEQVIDLIIGKCQEMIDTNEIFVEGDKDAFLKNFVEPYLKSNNFNSIRETASVKPPRQKYSNENTTFGEVQYKGERKKAGHTKLKVTFPNGNIIDETEAIDTFIKTMQEFGFEKVQQLSENGGLLIISDKADNGQKQEFKRITNTPFFINSGNSTEAKKKIIEKVAHLLRTEINVEVLPK